MTNTLEQIRESVARLGTSVGFQLVHDKEQLATLGTGEEQAGTTRWALTTNDMLVAFMVIDVVEDESSGAVGVTLRTKKVDTAWSDKVNETKMPPMRAPVNRHALQALTSRVRSITMEWKAALPPNSEQHGVSNFARSVEPDGNVRVWVGSRLVTPEQCEALRYLLSSFDGMSPISAAA
jgi:hypothetical protein